MRYFDLLSDLMGHESPIRTPNENYLKYEVQIKEELIDKAEIESYPLISLFIDDLYLSQK